MPENFGSLFILGAIIFLFISLPLVSAAGQNNTLELKYDSDSLSYDFYSLGSSGHAVDFLCPGTITITGIKIFGRMYGNSPDNPVFVRIWDNNFKHLYDFDIAYRDFPRDEAGWITVPVSPLLRSGDFYVAVFTESAPLNDPEGGVSIGYDTSTKSGHSHIVLGGNNKKVQDVNIGPDKDIPVSQADWKIRILYSPSSSDVPATSSPDPSLTPSLTPFPTSVPTPPPTYQPQEFPASFLLVIAIIILAVVCLGAFGYYKYRMRTGSHVPLAQASASQISSTYGHHDVFISYAHTDKPVADAVCAKLESRNIRCWIAPRDVPPGKNFPEAIMDGIESSRIMVIIFSSHSNNSEHVIREANAAINKSLIIIPFRIEDVLPSKSMEYLIGTPHWLDAITPPLERHLDTLADLIKKILTEDKCKK